MAHYDLLETVTYRPLGLLRYLPILPQALRWGSMTMAQAAERFRNPFLRKAFPTIQYDFTDIPVLIHLNMLAQCARRNYGFPVGGSLPFSRSIEQRFLDLGGTITYGRRVDRVRVERGRAVAVHLDDDSEIGADAVISNAPAHATLFRCLDGVSIPLELRARYAKADSNIVMGVHVSLGVARDLSDEPRALVLFLDEPVRLADRTVDRITVELYGFDPTLAPAGKGVIKALMDTDYGYWASLAEDRAAYEDAKVRLLDEIIRLLEPRFPGLSAQIDVTDVATPLTTERFTGHGIGYVPESGQPDVISMLLAKPLAVPSVRNLWLVGQSAGGAGIPGCAAQGRRAGRLAARVLG